MSKRKDTQKALELVLELLRRIPRTRKVTVKELHEQLSAIGINRNIRHIQRQLLWLSQRYDIECDDRSKPYGYRWKEQARGLNLPTLSEQESLLLTLAEVHLKSLLPVSLMKSMETFFQQARHKLGPQFTDKKEREWLTKVRTVANSQPLLPPKIKPEVFEAVSQALYNNHYLNIDYISAAGKNSKNSVMPLGLVQQNVGLYLVCRFDGYDNERILSLHRIRTAEISGLSFKRPANFSLEKYEMDGHFGFGNGELITLSFEIEKLSGVHLLEMRLSTDQQVKEIGDYYEITATLVDTPRLDWWLLGFGTRVKNIQKKPAGIKSH